MSGAGAGPDQATNSLGRRLRRQREQASPVLVGLPSARSRRRTGLRRSEVAELAGISEGYYARIEQGHSVPSAALVEVLVNVLRFEPAERAALLAEAEAETVRRRSDGRKNGAATLADGFRATGPAFAFDLDGRVVAWNDLADAVLCDLRDVEPAERVLPRLIVRAGHHAASGNCGLAEVVDDISALLRFSTAVTGGRRLDRLLGALLRTCDGFGSAWERSEVTTDEVWRAFRYDGLGEFVLRRRGFNAAHGAEYLSLAYEPGGSQLAERALDRIRSRRNA